MHLQLDLHLHLIALVLISSLKEKSVRERHVRGHLLVTGLLQARRGQVWKCVRAYVVFLVKEMA